jgi:hypothetical protein
MKRLAIMTDAEPGDRLTEADVQALRECLVALTTASQLIAQVLNRASQSQPNVHMSAPPMRSDLN